MPEEYKPTNPDTDELYNREPGVVIIPGSNYAKEMEKFEQSAGKYGSNPGNPYVFRAYPMMLYRAELYNGKACCMAAPPDPNAFASADEYRRKEEGAKSFSERCQRIVQNEGERTKAFESGWRESPAAAVAHLEGRENTKAVDTAVRQYEDRNMGEAAKAEAAAAVEEAGGEHLPEIPRKPVARRKKVARKKTTRRKA